MATAGNLALDGGDPRLHDEVLIHGTAASKLHLMNDSNIPFEEYLHFASITRAEEMQLHRSTPKEKRTVMSTLKGRFRSGEKNHVTPSSPPSDGIASGDEKRVDGGPSLVDERHNAGDPMAYYSHPSEVSDAEWKSLSRAVRTAGWSSIFYLITTDILGPFSTPWAFAQMGYGPGVALYTVFAAFASLSGYYIWKVFMQMDSDRYPLRDFGIAFFRVYGPAARHFVNVLQSVQLILTVSALILGQGQSIAQVSAGTSKPVCFVVCLLIFTLIGMVLGQIRTLQKFGWLANFAIWVNLLTIFISMGVAANTPPNFTATENSFGPKFAEGPIHTYGGTPPPGMASGGDGFIGSLNGLNQAVYSYGGAMLFFNFLSEMRHPWDFWKGLICAQVFIYVCYMFFGIFVYSYQGQFAFNPVMQGLSPYNYQTAANILYIISGLIAAALYGNIGIKVVYNNIFMELFSAPPLTIRRGKILWVLMVPIYWALAFLIAAAIPQFSYISGLIGAVCILSFTYTFPAILFLGFTIKKDAMLPEETYDEATHTYNRVDNGMRRWTRGYMVKWHLNTFNLIYFLGAMATCALGTYSSVEGLISAFSGNSVATSFGCAAPV